MNGKPTNRPLAITAKMGKKQVIAALQQNGSLLKDAREGLRADREVVLAAVRQDGTALAFASEELRGDKEVVTEALAVHETAANVVPHVSPALWGDREFVLSTIRDEDFAASRYNSSSILVLLRTSAELQRDPEVVLAARARSENWGTMVPAELGQFLHACVHNREIMLEVVSKDWHTLRIAGQGLREDREVVLAAVGQSGCALQHASADLRKDFDLVQKAAEKDATAWKWLSPSLESDRDRYLEAGRSGHQFLGWLQPPLAQDRAFVLEATRLANQELVWSRYLQDDQELTKAVRSRVAFRGEAEAPVARVEVSPQPDNLHRLDCSILFELSGRSVEMPMDAEATLNDLAMELVLKRPKTVKAFRRVALFFVKKARARSGSSSISANISGPEESLEKLEGEDKTVPGSSTQDEDDEDEEEDEEFVFVTPWDWNRPLRDFCYAGGSSASCR